MNIFEFLLLGLGLSMDAVAVSMTNGLTIKSMRWKGALADAAAFGLFQGLMPLIGFFAGSVFANYMEKISHWIALILLGFIGVKMLIDAFKQEDEVVSLSRRLTLKLLFVQAVATSIDALAVGVSFAAMRVNIFSGASVIALTTFICSFIAVYVGKKCGDFLGKKAGILGGVILIAIGLKIFIEGML